MKDFKDDGGLALREQLKKKGIIDANLEAKILKLEDQGKAIIETGRAEIVGAKQSSCCTIM